MSSARDDSGLELQLVAKERLSEKKVPPMCNNVQDPPQCSKSATKLPIGNNSLICNNAPMCNNALICHNAPKGPEGPYGTLGH